MTFSAPAYAKVNIGLQILGKRADGYHNINSVFVPINLFDDVEVENTDSIISLDCTPKITDSPESNLAYIAASKLKQALGSDQLGVKIRLIKRIPHGAGLGGGSSDAATTLNLLRMIWPGTTPELLHTIAQSVGSDVPFFLKNSMATVSGRGEHIAPFHLNLPWTFLLVCPDIHINTGMAYSTVLITEPRSVDDLASNLIQSIENNTLNVTIFRNDFESSIFLQHPYLSTIKQLILDTGSIFASMTGSGSTIYGLYTSVENARIAESVINTNHAGLKTYICQPVQQTKTSIE
jgi:4-diphosphocytidyl-2-C-methyl-D-erythritol kinase